MLMRSGVLFLWLHSFSVLIRHLSSLISGVPFGLLLGSGDIGDIGAALSQEEAARYGEGEASNELLEVIQSEPLLLDSCVVLLLGVVLPNELLIGISALSLIGGAASAERLCLIVASSAECLCV